MKTSLIIVGIFISGHCLATQDFASKAQEILKPIKKAFQQEIKIGLEEGPYNALDACHIKAAHLTEFEASDKYEFGRTSAKLRSQQNKAPDWINPIIKEYANSNAKKSKASKVYQIQGKKVYIEPIYISASCLHCHGQPVKSVQNKIKKKYPQDQATGYQLGEFRGLFWIKEK